MVFRDNRWVCPRDGASLEHTRIGDRRFMRCAQCRGAFVEMAVLSAMATAMDGVLPVILSAPRERRLPCPGCQRPLEPAVSPLADGRLDLDGCAEHGVWLDGNELTRLLEHIGLTALAQRR